MAESDRKLYLDLLGSDYNDAFMLGILKVVPSERKVFFDYHFLAITGIEDVKPNCWVDLDSSGLKPFLQNDKKLYDQVHSIFTGETKKDVDSLDLVTPDEKKVQVKIIVNERHSNGVPKEIIAVFIDVSIIEQSVTEATQVRALFETSQEISKASTWWTNYDEGSEFFYQNDNGAIAAGLVPSKDKRYSIGEYSEMRENAAKLNEDYRKAVNEEIASFADAWEGITDTFRGRTPMMTPQGNIVWVDSRGKVVLRYEDGTPRFVVAVDIFISEEVEKEEALFKLQSIMSQGLVNSGIGVWWHDYEEGHYYFHQTDSYKAVMGIEDLGEKDMDSQIWANYIKRYKKEYPMYIKHLDNDAELFRQCLEGEIDGYENIVPILSKGNEIIWIEVRATCIRRNDDGMSTLMVGVNVDVTDRIKKEEQIIELETKNVALNAANKSAIEAAKLLVWSKDLVKSKSNHLYYANDLYIKTLGLPTYENGLVSEQDYNQTMVLEGETIESWEKIRENFRKLVFGEIESFEGVVVKHQNYETKEIVYLEHNASVSQKAENGSALIIGGYIRDITESIVSQQEIEELNVQNVRLKKADSLAIKSGQVLVWYSDHSEFDGNKYFFGSGVFANRLGLDATEEGLILVSDYKKTIYTNTEEAKRRARKFEKVSEQIKLGEIDKYEKILVQHQSLTTGEVFYMEHTSEIEERNADGTVQSAGGFFLDVTDLMSKQREIEFLATRDTLTGLYNRNHFEQYIVESLPSNYSVFVFDLDGLKLINDALGHTEGDAVIQFAANLLKIEFGKDSMVARLGGDEFTVISTIIDKTEISTRFRNIREAVADSNSNTIFDIDLSYGHAIVMANDVTFNTAFSMAENIMYKRKLTERRNRKNISLEALMDALDSRTDETKDHRNRLASYCTATMKELGFIRVAEIEDMDILAKVHDIGKLTIEKEILFKKEPLNFEDYEVIKKHTESGYKIIKNILDSDFVSDGVLHHHERWDGTGYPMGLAGTEIPLPARILAVCDAYEVMNSGRNYVKPISKEKALQELKDCSGTQFDKDVVNALVKVIERGDVN